MSSIRMIGRRAMLGTALSLLAGASALAQGAGAGAGGAGAGAGPGAGPGPGPGPGAGPGPGPGPGPGMGHRRGGGGGYGMMTWDLAGYLAALKEKLGITAKQEAAWTDYADTVTGVGGQMQAAHQIMFEAMGTASWQERQTMMNQMFEARQQAFQLVHEAALKLLPELTPAQRAQAQGALPGLGYGPRVRRGYRQGPPGTSG